MKKIADFLVPVALVCIALLMQVATAQSQGPRNTVAQTESLPRKCNATAPSYSGVTIAQLKEAANQPFYNLLQVPNPIDDPRFFVKQQIFRVVTTEPASEPQGVADVYRAYEALIARFTDLPPVASDAAAAAA